MAEESPATPGRSSTGIRWEPSEKHQLTSPVTSGPGAGRRRVVETSVEELAERARDLAASKAGRTMLGLVGPPGAGKSTLASALAEELADLHATVAPFDGFHLANATLDHAHLRDQKGALETFDLDGYAHLLERLRVARATVYAPAYDRSVGEPIASAVTVPAQCQLVITEGNYLLANHPEARRARRSLDAVWFIDLDERTRTQRLVQRHVMFGKTPAQAQQWVAGTDHRNAELVSRTRDRADLVVQLIDSHPRP